MRFLRLCSAAVAASFAISSFGGWTYDPDSSSITDGKWTLNVTASGDDLTITHLVEGSGDLDFTSFSADTGKRVVALGTDPLKSTGGVFDMNGTITSLVAPDLVSMADYSLRNCTKLTDLVVSERFSRFGGYALRYTPGLLRISPARFDYLTSVGTCAFQYAGSASMEPMDFVFPSLTSVSTYAFQEANVLRSFATDMLTSLTADMFLSNMRLQRLELSNLADMRVVRFCKECTNLGDVRLSGTFTALWTDAFLDCSSLSNVVIKAPVATVNEGALKNIAPNASIVFYGEAPTFQNGSLSAANAEEGFCRARVYAVLGPSSASWAAAVAPNADRFEADKTRPDYPGEKAFGLLYDGTAYSWVIEPDPLLSVASTVGAYGAVEPAFGKYYEMADGETVEFSAPEGDVDVSDVFKVRYGGWKLYVRATDGTRTLLDEDDTLSGSFVYEAGVQYDLEWQGVRQYRVQVNAAAGGTATPTDVFVTEGEEVAVTAEPDEGKAFGAWFGVPVAHLVENPLRLRVTEPLSVTPAFNGVWRYDAGAQVVSNDIWRLNVTAEGTELSVNLAGADFAGEGALLLTSFPQDVPGYHVTAFADCGKNSSQLSLNAKISALVTPEVRSVGQWTFYYASGLQTVYLSPSVFRVGDGAFRNTSNVKRFHPSRMPSLASLGPESFILFGSNAKTAGVPYELVDFDMPALTTLDANTVFADSALIRSFRADNVSSLRGSSLFSGSKSLERVELGGSVAAIPENMFKDCNLLSNVVIKAPVAAVAAGAFTNISPFARVTIWGAPPTFAAGSLSAKDAESKDCRICVEAVTACVSTDWAAAVAPQADVFASYRGKPDDPGDSAIGLLWDGTAYSWVARKDFSLEVVRVGGDPVGSVTPDYGFHFDYTNGTTVAFSAPADDMPVSDDQKARFSGWKLYSIGPDGAVTLLDSGKGLSGSFTYQTGVFYRLAWEAQDKFLVRVESTGDGTVDWEPTFVAAGETVRMTAVPADGKSFGLWNGVPADGCACNPTAFTVTGPMTVAPVFVGKWRYNADEGVIFNDIWRLNVEVMGPGELAITMKTDGIAGSGPLCLTSFPDDVPGYHVTAVKGCDRGFSIFSQDPVKCIQDSERHCPTAFVAPEVKSVGSQVFAYASHYSSPDPKNMPVCEMFVFSEGITNFGASSLYCAKCIGRFHPTSMPSLISVGQQAFSYIERNTVSCDFDMPALTSLSKSQVFTGCGLLASVSLAGVVTVADATFSGCANLTNVVFGRGLTTLGARALAAMPGGATVCLPNRRVPEMGDTCIYSTDAGNRVRILIRRNFAGSGWSDLIAPLTDADRARADFPGEMTVGTISVVVGEVTYTSWVVETEKAQGLSIIVR